MMAIFSKNHTQSNPAACSKPPNNFPAPDTASSATFSTSRNTSWNALNESKLSAFRRSTAVSNAASASAEALASTLIWEICWVNVAFKASNAASFAFMRDVNAVRAAVVSLA